MSEPLQYFRETLQKCNFQLEQLVRFSFNLEVEAVTVNVQTAKLLDYRLQTIYAVVSS